MDEILWPLILANSACWARSTRLTMAALAAASLKLLAAARFGATIGSQSDDDSHPALRPGLGRQRRKGPGPLSACRGFDCHNQPVRRRGESSLTQGEAAEPVGCGGASRGPAGGDGSGPSRDHPGGQWKATGSRTLPNRNGSAVLVVPFVALRYRVFGIDNDFEGVRAGA